MNYTVLRQLFLNSRFYILVASLLASIFGAAFLRLTIVSDQVYLIRLQQLYGLLAALLLYKALLLTPVSKLVGPRPWIKQLLFARRAIGVAAAYFTLLHLYIVITDQLGGLSGIGLLPNRFKLSLLLGAIATVVLIALAATSFDRAIRRLTFPRWKQLHRLAYLAGVLIMVHIWLIGTHVENGSIRLATYVALALLLGLESLRLSGWLQRRFGLDTAARYALVGLLLLVSVGAIASLPLLAKNYHADHDMEHGTTTHLEHEGMH